ncbi:unnamed protein product [Larinioides sclopetarius]|uniref:HTH CENPB-type domain-containing protein n=1 Tax=Larinioides sclopetarius TaxID=280406 RepID=A0AAV2AP37_9ARAC
MAKRGHYGRWSELDLLMAVGTYKNGGAGLNECSRIYNVPKATIKRHADEQNSTTIEIKPRKRAHVQHGLCAIVDRMRKKIKTNCSKNSALETSRGQLDTIQSCEEFALHSPERQENTIKSCEESTLEILDADLNKSIGCEESALEIPGDDGKPKSCGRTALETPSGDVKPKSRKKSTLGTPGRVVKPKSCKESVLETPGRDLNKTKTCEESTLESPSRDVKSESFEESTLEKPDGRVNNSKTNTSKRGQYGRWSENDLLKAVAAYKNGKKGLNECSRIYNVPKATIKRHADGKNSVANEIKSLGRQPTFSPVMEKILSEYLLHLKESYFGLTIKEIRKLVFEIAEKHGLPHSFNKSKKMAGKKWFYSFLRRNPQLSLRKSEPPECT